MFLHFYRYKIKTSSLDQFHEKWCTMCLYMCIDVGKLFIDKAMWYRILVNSVSHTHTHRHADIGKQIEGGRERTEWQREREGEGERGREGPIKTLTSVWFCMTSPYEIHKLFRDYEFSQVLSQFFIVFQLLLLLILYIILCSCVSPNIILLSS